MVTLTGTPRFGPVIDRHVNWLAVNPIQGCPKRCAYCFLLADGLTGIRPSELLDPSTTLDRLISFEHYRPTVPIALYTNSDVFSTREITDHFRRLLDQVVERALPNPVVLVSKCRPSRESIADLAAATAAGIKTVVFMSLSGLPGSVERGVRASDTRAGIEDLAIANIPVVHYWRPLTPLNSTVKAVDDVYEFVQGKVLASVITGLKLPIRPAADFFELWPESKIRLESDRTSAAAVPSDFSHSLKVARNRNGAHPVFERTSCALAMAILRPNETTAGTSRCATASKWLGATFCCTKNYTPSEPDWVGLSARLGHLGVLEGDWKYDSDNRALELGVPLRTSELANLTHDFRLQVTSPSHEADTYWRNTHSASKPNG